VTHRTAASAAPLASAPVTPESLINEQRSQSKESKEHEKTKERRVSPTPSSKDKQLRTSTSFVMNLFRGQFYPNELFPYPNVLNEEQRDNVKMLIDPIWKFFEEKNDAAKNDQLEKVFLALSERILFSFLYSDSG
jgi:very long chain acyl-CoA dehydrogenase